MKHSSGASLIWAAVLWLTAAPTFAQTDAQASAETDASSTEASSFAASPISFEFEADFDVLLALGNTDADVEHAFGDLTVRGGAEHVAASGRRWGATLELSASSADGRRGFSRALPACSLCPTLNGVAVAGALTGLSGPSGLDPSSDRIYAPRAEVYVQTGWARIRAGLGQSAATLERASAPRTLRLASADAPRIDPTGLALAATDLTLADGAPMVSVQSQRLVGFRAALSYAPSSNPCAQACRPSGDSLVRPEIDDIWALGVSFDRRRRASGVRWSGSVGVEVGQSAGAFGAVFDDPWVVSARVVREREGVRLGASWLRGEDGFANGRYEAFSLAATLERGDWLFGAESAWARSDLIAAEGGSLMVGASRLVGANGVIGAAIGLAEETSPDQRRTAARLMLETGLRF